MTTPDVNDVSRCPVGKRCLSCEKQSEDLERDNERAGLAVYTVATLIGVICMTLCPDCADEGTPRLDLSADVFSTILHLGHVGVPNEFHSPRR